MSVRSIGCVGFKNISLINPRHPWPTKEGINASKHLSSIAKKIKVFDNIEKSIKDSDLVIATSVRKRDFHIPFIKLEDIKKKKQIIFAHMDMDTCESTKFALIKIKPFLKKGSIILFDELYGYPNWEKEEYKAFEEVFNKDEFKYVAFCESEVAIEIL